jgi:transcriptional regulator with XRE-family HTH domain
MSQEKLGEALGLTFQQVQKYERGANRIGSGRLYHLSKVLDVPVSFFFDDLPEGQASTAAQAGYGTISETPVESFEAEAMSRRETLELVCAYYRITDSAVRKRVFELVKSIAGPSPDRKRRGRPPGSGRKLLASPTLDG